MKPNVKVVQIPTTGTQSLVELSKRAGLFDPMSQAVAKLYNKETSNPEDSDGKILWISSFRGKTDCLHSQYAVATKSQTGLSRLLTIMGLFALAVSLHENRKHKHPMNRFTGVIYAFGSARCAENTVLNYESHTGHRVLDMQTPVLWIEKGIPKSTYFIWHTEHGENGNVAWQMSSDVFSLEEVTKRAKEAC